MPLDTQSIANLRIIDEEDGTVVAERGMISCNGDTVKVYDWNVAKGKYDQKDRLRGAELKINKRFSRVIGQSELFRQMAIDRDARTRTLKLEHGAAKPYDQLDEELEDA